MAKLKVCVIVCSLHIIYLLLSCTCSCIHFPYDSRTHSFPPHFRFVHVSTDDIIECSTVHSNSCFLQIFSSIKREQKTVEVHLPSTLFHLNKDKMPSRIHSFVPRVFFSAEAFFSRGKKVQLHSKQCPCDEFKLAQPLAAHFFATPKNDMNNVSKM